MVENEWKIAKLAGACCSCSAALEGANGFSALLQRAEGLVRQDYCGACFQDKRPADVFYFWKSAPRGNDDETQRRQRPAVDVEYVLEFFKRLEDESTPQKAAFRFILALMLARKKLLVFESRKKETGGQDVQIFREKRGGQAHRVVEPELSEEEIAAVSAELGVLLGLTPPPAPAVAPVEAEEASAPAARGEEPVAQGESDTGGERR